MKVWYNSKENAVKLKIETPEEVFFISHFIMPGIFVTAETFRSKEILRDGKKVKVGKEKIKVTIEVEKIEVKENALKLLGRIVASSKEVSGYHSLILEPGKEMVIKKEWKNWEIEKLKKFAKPSEKVLACIMDEREAEIFIIGDKIERKASIYSGFFKAQENALKTKYFSEIFEKIKAWKGKIILAGPGFAKEEFFKYLEEKGFDKKRVFIDSIAHVGIAGVKELLNCGTLEKVFKTSRISQEAKEVKRLFEEIAKDGLVVYGEEEVKKALYSGALEKILVSTKLMRKYYELINEAEKMGTKIMFISDLHPEGERFYNFCGIAGFLRFKI